MYLRKTLAITLGLSLTLSMVADFTQEVKADVLVQESDRETFPQPIKVITADDLRTIAADSLTGDAVEKDAVTGEAGTPDMGYKVDSEIVVKNPFGSKKLQESLKEYEEWACADELQWEKFSGVWKKPVWEKGLTLSYWINVPSGESVSYHAASALRWELSGEEYYQADDYAKYLTNLHFHKEVGGYSKEDMETAKLEESKTVYGSKHYFKFLETDGVDEDGAPLPVLHQEPGEVTGPVYDYRFMRDTSDKETKYAPFFAYNPNYQKGYYYSADGKYELLYEDNYYDGYNTLYMSEENIRKKFKLSEDMVITAGAVFTDDETAHRYSTDSLTRVADCYGEFQIDTDNSILWVSDDKTGIQRNPNNKETYGAVEWMQGGNLFYMNSWVDSQIRNEQNQGTYDSAVTRALSPVTSLDASGEAVAYGNCNEWHQVTLTMQNDWVEFYVDGVCVDVYNNYSTEGRSGINDQLQFKRLNKGMSLRYERNYPGEYKRWNLSNGAYVCRLFMDWITDEDATLHIGGIGKNAARYNLADSAMEFSVDEMRFYDQLLTDEQIMTTYEEQEKRLLDEKEEITTPPGVSAEAVYLGDVNEDDNVTLEDASKILRFALLLENPKNNRQDFLADVNTSGKIELEDASKALQMALLLEEWRSVLYSGE